MRLIVGISGASGVIMGYYLLKVLHEMPEIETHLVISEGAAKNFAYETNCPWMKSGRWPMLSMTIGIWLQVSPAGPLRRMA